MKTAIIATTRNGVDRAAQLGRLMPAAELIIPERFAAGQGSLDGLTNTITDYQGGGLSEIVAARFSSGYSLICCLSVGAVVRLIAPYLVNKASDPAVIAIDEQAQFVVPVVSGHLGGANALAEIVAQELGAQAVITTASDSSGLPAIDLLGKEQGWQVEANRDALCRAAAAMVNGEPIALIEEAASWQPQQPVPANLKRVSSWQEINPQDYAALLWVTDSTTSAGSLYQHDSPERLTANSLTAPANIDPLLAERLVIYRS
ncbi:cobalamin biosynthesis central domain-containing protein [Halorhodospira halochloris]|nr:cobalamin biosynthesis central domain-containing protein [Halorhodospira halochloris]MCG5547617.1 cobalamin biosynthesis protein CbiG [Halorhodospira halochloris]